MKRIILVTTGMLMLAGALVDHHKVFGQAPDGAQVGLGSKIVFSSTQNVVPEPPPGLDINPLGQLYLMNGDGTEQRQLTDFFGAKLAAVCSPNARQIAFLGVTPFNSRPGVPTIFLMNLDTFVDQTGAGLTELVSGANFPSWSPDGKKITFQSFPPPRRDVFVLDLQTLELTNLTNNPNDPADDAWDDYRPDWSPDGRRIAFTSNRSGNPEIYVMNADGSDPVRLTFSNGASSVAPDWSPNGQQIVFQSNRDFYPAFPNLEFDPGSEIYVMKADGSEVRRLTNNVARDLDPAWSPNGAQIVFDSDRIVAQTKQVYVMNADGSDQRALTGAPGESGHAGWCQGHAAQP